MWARARIAILLIVAVVIETTFGADLRVLGVAPDLMLLLALSGGLVCGPTAGAWIGFCAGLLADLTLTTTPLGLSALAWCIVGWGIGTLRAYLLPDGRAARPALAFLATIGAILLFLIVGELVGQTELAAPGRDWVIRVGLVEGFWNALLIIPTVVALGWAARGLPSVEELGRPEALVVR